MKENVTVFTGHLGPFIPAEEIMATAARYSMYLDMLLMGRGKGSEFTGWIHLPEKITAEVAEIEETASILRESANTTVVIGIGGSYLGSRAVLEAIGDSFGTYRTNGSHQVLFAGQNLCPDYMRDLLSLLDQRDYNIIVISKSGTTTEPAVAFRLLREHLVRKVGLKASKRRIVAVTDESKGALRQMADTEGYRSFIIPDDVGGRYSVMTAVGLLPLAAGGAGIREFIGGAAEMKALTTASHNHETNPALLYAAARNLLYASGKNIEIMVNYTPKLHYISEWWKQLYGESEGKGGKGIFPASVDNTTDLHSMGQYIQDGERRLFETLLSVESGFSDVKVPLTDGDGDNLNFLAGKSLSFINRAAMEGTRQAHTEGGVPNITINIPAINEFYLGQLLYMLEMACGVSGYALDVNPFDQPGVEAYKKKMFSLLGKP